MRLSHLMIKGFLGCLWTLGLATAQQQSDSKLLKRPAPKPTTVKVSSPSDGGALVGRFHSLSPGAQSQVSRTIGHDRKEYVARRTAAGFQMENADHGISAEFQTDGVIFQAGPNSWGLSLRRFGYGDNQQPVVSAAPRSEANRIEYNHDGLTEWYENGPMGVEQGFTILRSREKQKGKPLNLELAVSGNMATAVDADGHGIILRRNSADILRYAGLVATDAAGRNLKAIMRVKSNLLRISVEDDQAQFPISIDPMVQSVKLTNDLSGCQIGQCAQGQANDNFGYSVAMSADGTTLVVGAPNVNIGGVSTGAAYVFVKPSRGWGACGSPLITTCNNYASKLLASDGASGDSFGFSVSITNNGGQILVGAPNKATATASNVGQVYEFFKPANGWGSVAIVNQTSTFGRETDPPHASLGWKVAISSDGNTRVIGAPGYNSSSGGGGAVLVFYKGLSESVLSISSDVGPDGVGTAIAVSGGGGTVLVGASPANSAGEVLVFAPGSCCAFFFEKIATLTASNGSAGSGFGSSVAISGDGTIAVATQPAPYNGAKAGAYLFTRPSTGWADATESVQLTGSDNPAGLASLSISGDATTVIAGTGYSASPGAAYVFAKPAAGWTSATETKKLTASDGVAADAFGSSVSLSSNGTAAAIGAYGATIGSNANQGASYVFTGYAGTPTASVAPSSIAFGNQAIGTTSGNQQVTISNTGSAPLVVSSVATTSPFSTTQNCPGASISPGSSCTENLDFAPTGLGSANGSLSITDNSGGTAGTTQQVSLTGTGVKASSSTVINSASPNPALVGQAVAISFSVSPQNGDSLIPSGTVTVVASTGESCVGSAPSGSCSITFTTAATRTIVADYAGDTNFNSSGSAGVSENVQDFALSVSPTSQSVTQGKSANYQVIVTSANGFTGSVSLSCSGAPIGTVCTMAPTSVNPGGTSAKSVATVSVSKSAKKGSYTLTFSGTSSGITRSASATLSIK